MMRFTLTFVACFAFFSLTIQAQNLEVGYNSTGGDPTVELIETQDNDYSRIFFTNNSYVNTNRWSLAGRVGSTADHSFALSYNGTARWTYNETTGGLGIGTTSPSAKLDIQHNSDTDSPHIELTENNSVDYARLKFKNSTSESFWDVAGRADATNGAVLNFFYNDGTSGTNVMSIDGDERNVDIGISPSSNTSAKLYVYNDGLDENGNRNYAIFGVSDKTSTAPRHGLYGEARGEGTGSGDGQKTGVTGNAYTSANTKIGVRANASGGTGANYGVYALTGKDGVNNYAVYGDANSGLSTHSPPVWAGYFAGDVFATGSYLPSDEKLKTNIQTAPSSLRRLQALGIKTYQYKPESREEISLDGREQTGFIAQNVATVFPELVKKVGHPLTSPDEQEAGAPAEYLEFTGVNYVGFIPHLTNAIQEQQAQIEALQNANEKLNAANEELISRLERIEASLQAQPADVQQTAKLTAGKKSK